jgi:hypothetical protein
MAIRDDVGVLLVVLCEWPCGADRAFMIRVRNITLQESGICNIHSGRVERQCVVKWADRDLEATAIISKKKA